MSGQYVSAVQLNKAELRFIVGVLDDYNMSLWVDSPHKRKRLALIAKIREALSYGTPVEAAVSPTLPTQ